MTIGRFYPNNNGPTVTIVVPEMAINYSGVCCPRRLLPSAFAVRFCGKAPSRGVDSEILQPTNL